MSTQVEQIHLQAVSALHSNAQGGETSIIHRERQRGSVLSPECSPGCYGGRGALMESTRDGADKFVQ